MSRPSARRCSKSARQRGWFLRREIEIAGREPHQPADRRLGLVGRGDRLALLEPLEDAPEGGERARIDLVDERVEVGEDGVDRAERAADLPRQVARLEAGEAFLADRLLGRVDQLLPQFLPPVRGLRHRYPRV